MVNAPDNLEAKSDIIRLLLFILPYVINMKAFNFTSNIIIPNLHFPSWAIPRKCIILIMICRACLPYSNGSIFRSRSIRFPSRWEANTMDRTVMTLVASYNHNANPKLVERLIINGDHYFEHRKMNKYHHP